MNKTLSIVVVLNIVFSSFSMFAPQVKAQAAYLTDFVQLTTNPNSRARYPSWSPDGSKIAYFAHPDGSLWWRHIWVMNADGSGKTQLTFGNVVDEAPGYSPDGTKIVFMRYGLRGIDGSDLIMMNADGTNIQQLTSTGLHRGQPRWSNDGQRIAFYYGGAGTDINEIHIMDADGTNEITMVSSSYPYMNVYWSPDDTKIVYSMNDGIWLVGTSPPYEKEHLFATSLPAFYPVFSPDGKYILFAQSEIGQPQDLYLIDSNGNFVAQLTYDSMIDYPFDWSPDGQYIAFGSKRAGPTYIWRAKIVIPIPGDVNSDGTAAAPFWTQWWFWTIIALGTTTSVFAFTTVRCHRKKARITKEPKGIAAKPISKKEYKVCPNCGAKLPVDSAFCGKCGTSLK